MVTPDKPAIRNVLATPAGGQWLCQPIALGSGARICGVCRKQRLEPYVAECPNCGAAIVWDMGWRVRGWGRGAGKGRSSSPFN